jgi:predicted ATPase
MIRTVEIKNFKCFKSLYIRDLKRFNVVVGEGGSGKTALLEAIFLAASANPEIWMRLRQWRGSSNAFRLSGTRASYESLFRDIFFNFEKRRPARIEFSDDAGHVRTLKISYPSQDKYSARVVSESPDGSSDENSFTFEPIVFGWKSKGKEQKARVDVKDGKVQFKGFNTVFPAWFSSPLINEGQNVAQFFSELSLKNKTAPLLTAMHNLYPELEDIGVESIAGDLALCASTASLKERLPVSTISAGMTRFLSIMLGVASNPGGVLLIDEFEVGFYYATLPKALDEILSFCDEYNVQIIATTHSYEFMQTLVPLINKRKDAGNEFCFLRTTRTDGESQIKLLENAPAAIESVFEVR